MGERNVRFDRGRKRLRELEKKNRSGIRRETNDKPVDPDQLSLGSRVKILTLNQNGEIVALPDERGNLQVQVGRMKIGVKLKDIMLIDQPKPSKKPKTTGYGSLYRKKSQNISTSVDVEEKTLTMR